MHKRFDHLWTEFLEGDLKTEELAELQQLLAEQPELLERAADWYATHRGLGFLLQPTDPQVVRDEIVQRIEADQKRFVASVRNQLGQRSSVSRKPSRRLWGYVAVAAAAVVLTIGVQYIVWSWLGGGADHLAGSFEYVATLIRGDQAEWGSREMPPTGGRLAPGTCSLRRGSAAIQFDTGTVVIVDAPAEVRLDSRSGMTVHRGRVLLRAAEEVDGFLLRTPARDVVDLGTEFAVAVDDTLGTTDVHVLEGAVLTSRAGQANAVLKAGQSMRYFEAEPQRAEPTPFQPQRLVERLARMVTPPEQLLAQENMDYPIGSWPLQQLNGGLGWADSWRLRLPRENAVEGDSSSGKQRILSAQDALLGTAGNALEMRGPMGLVRHLAQPVAMDRDAIYYLSFWVRAVPVARTGLLTNPQLVSRVSLRVSEDWDGQAVAFWLNRSGRPQINGPTIGGFLAQEIKPLTRPCFWVAKIAASRSQPDQVFLKIFTPGERIPEEEPFEWTVKTHGFHSDSRYNVLFLNAVNHGTHWYDEIRLGTTWASVTKLTGG